MSRVTLSQTVTLRVPIDLYEKTVRLANERNQSLNAIFQEGAQKLLQDEDTRALSDGFDLLASFPEECDVEYAIFAQSEVALRNEP